MKNYSELDRSVNVDNIFHLNRLGLSDSFESGRSLTLVWIIKRKGGGH